jgi:hypothetical protein
MLEIRCNRDFPYLDACSIRFDEERLRYREGSATKAIFGSLGSRSWLISFVRPPNNQAHTSLSAEARNPGRNELYSLPTVVIEGLAVPIAIG